MSPMGFFVGAWMAGVTGGASSPCDQARQAAAAKAAAPKIKGKNGIPGTTAIMAISKATVPSAPSFQKDLVFLEEPTNNYLDTMIRVIGESHTKAPTTNILAFLPTANTIKKIATGCAPLGREVVIITGATARDNTIDLAGTNKLFLSTPVAEVGLTINNLSHVIDSGLHLSVEYNPLRDCMVILLKPVTHASAIQRIGRVGRKMSGTAILLYTKDTMAKLKPYTEPNIVYAEFTTTLLAMIAADIGKAFWENPLAGVTNFWKFYKKKFMLADIDLIDNPATDSMRTALAKLYLTGMYSPYTGLTKLGALAGWRCWLCCCCFYWRCR